MMIIRILQRPMSPLSVHCHKEATTLLTELNQELDENLCHQPEL